MTLQVALSAPTLIRPDDGAAYRLGAGHYRLINGTGQAITAHLVNFGTGPAMVAGSISGAAGALAVEPGAAFMLGWSPRDTAWRALQMVGAQMPGPDGIPADAQLCAMRLSGPDGARPDVHPQLAPTPADTEFPVEALDGTTARITLAVAVEYLAGRLPALPGSQSDAWGY